MARGVRRVTYTIPEAAKLLGVGRNAAYGAVKKGQIPTITIGKRRFITRGWLDGMLTTLRNDAPRKRDKGAHQ